ncbi:hypothetical protein [Chitinophaga sp. MM2321]|uniref:hypothetical protein n=1 Tax=Chitinophaga sp. MM2321 TaxID=3137178 RepID=UPI0032D57BDB
MTQEKNLKKVTWLAVAMLLLTAVHHAYGAFIYHTPWRLHMVIIGIPAAVIVLLLHRMLVRNTRGQRVVRWIYMLLVLLLPVLAIGLYEGVYNHLLKDCLYYGGISPATFDNMFPPPMYEKPNNFLFELTGVTQAFLFFPLAAGLARFLKDVG